MQVLLYNLDLYFNTDILTLFPFVPLQTLDNLDQRATALNGRSKSNDKPDTYLAVIARALLSSTTGKMTLREIYKYAQENHSCYDNEGKGWKSSIRYNLTANECFVKEKREESGEWSSLILSSIVTMDTYTHKYLFKDVSNVSNCFELVSILNRCT